MILTPLHRICAGLMLCLSIAFANAQDTDIPRDTSFTIYSNYVKLSKRYPFVQPIAPQLPANVIAQENVTYLKIGARELHLDIYRPADSTKTYPGVLLIHGGGWSSGSKEHLVPMAQQLAARGYVTACAEYRLSPEAKFPAGVEDLKAAVTWLRLHAIALDTSFVAALGCSAGAHLASLLGTTGDTTLFSGEQLPGASARVQAVVNIDGIVSFIHPEADAEGDAASRWLGGDRTSAFENWKAASPLEYVDRNTPPFLFINSAQPRFHAGRDDMMAIMDEYRIYSEMHMIRDTPHGFWLVYPWYAETLAFTVRFLDRVLKGR